MRIVLLMLLLAVPGFADESGVFRVPLTLPDSLEKDRAWFEQCVLDAQRRVGEFARQHDWGHLVEESFLDRAEIYDDKARFDRALLELVEADPETILPPTFVAGLERRVLMVVSPAIYAANVPEGAEEDFYTKLMTHEMAHRLHIRILDGDEDAMGPVWFYEGFAVYAADQFEGNRPILTEEQIWEVVNDPERGNYRNYATVIRHFLARAPLPELVRRAGDANFKDYLKSRAGYQAGSPSTPK